MNIFNILDILALIVFSLCVLRGIRRGFLRMTFGLLSLLIALYLALSLYPYIGTLLREHTEVYDALKTHTISALGLGDIIENYVAQGEAAILSRLPLPAAILSMLADNNIPSVHQMLGVATLEDYVGSFIANILVNIISAAIVFILVILIMRTISSALRIIARLPVIRSFDKLGGAAAGALMGLVAVWILITLYLFFFAGVNPANEEIFNNSTVGQFLYDRGLLLRGLTDIR